MGRTPPAREEGFSLIEVMVSALLVSVAAIGLALMFSTGNTFVVAHGDDRVALGLAQQKIEFLRQMANPAVGSPANVATYTEGTGTWDTTPPLAVPAGSRTFTRLTCVQFVSDTDPNQPPYAGNLATNLPCDPYVDTSSNPPTASCSALGASCVQTATMRVTVIVTPTLIQADAVRVQGWLVP